MNLAPTFDDRIFNCISIHIVGLWTCSMWWCICYLRHAGHPPVPPCPKLMRVAAEFRGNFRFESFWLVFFFWVGNFSYLQPAIYVRENKFDLNQVWIYFVSYNIWCSSSNRKHSSLAQHHPVTSAEFHSNIAFPRWSHGNQYYMSLRYVQLALYFQSCRNIFMFHVPPANPIISV